jgi:putative redox protein
MAKANVKWIGGEQFIGVSPMGHAQVVDSDSKTNMAATPMDLLLVALGACTATDIVLILAKKRQKLEGLDVAVTGERAMEPPRVWNKLEIHYRLQGALEEKAVKDAIGLSEKKYCSVAATMQQGAQIAYTYEIIGPMGAATTGKI